MNLTTKQAAQALGIDETNVRVHCRSGRIKAQKFGHIWMIPREEIERFAQVPRRRGPKKKETEMIGIISKNKPSKPHRLGDLIGVDGSRGWNHGCQDYAILRYEGFRKAKVIEAQSCHSCWQVGHGRDHTFATVGDMWEIDENKIVKAMTEWATSVKWELD